MRRRRRDGEDEVAAECAAFLTGTLVERLETGGRAIPVWAWTNLLAHGSTELVAQSGARPCRHRLLARSWRTARAQLADLVLEMTHRGCSLDELQESVLVPLELDLASRPEVSFWSHHQWVGAVTDALHHHDHTRQSS
jgi:hypothetical protein